MGAFAGRQAILEMDSTPIAALTVKSMEMGNELIDISSDSSGDWTEKLNTLVGSKQVTINCSGVMSDVTLLTKSFNADPSATMDFIFPTELAGTTTGPTISGTFLMSSFSVSGENADKATFDASFESSGTITLTAAV